MIRIIVAVCAIFSATSASAQLPIGTISSKGYPLTNGAELNGCTIEFLNTHSDTNSSPPKLIGVSGSITLSASQKGAVYALKVVVQDMAMGAYGVTFTPNAPYEIHLASDSGTSTYGTKGLQLNTDTPGARYTALPFSDKNIEKMMEEIATTQKAVILFNREKGGSDVRVPVDFTVVDTDASGRQVRNNSAMQNFLTCQVQLFTKVRAELRGKN
jgi:hypothetical protein